MYENVSVIVSVTLCWGISMGSGENHQLEHNNMDVIFRSPVNICVTSIEVIIIVLRLIRLKVAKLWENQSFILSSLGTLWTPQIMNGDKTTFILAVNKTVFFSTS